MKILSEFQKATRQHRSKRFTDLISPVNILLVYIIYYVYEYSLRKHHFRFRAHLLLGRVKFNFQQWFLLKLKKKMYIGKSLDTSVKCHRHVRYPVKNEKK